MHACMHALLRSTVGKEVLLEMQVLNSYDQLILSFLCIVLQQP